MIPTAIPQPRSEDEIGPRQPGALYQTDSGAYEVLVLITDPREAGQLLRRKDAQWALIVRDVLRADSEPHATCAAWTSDDRLVRPGRATTAFVPAA